MKAKTIKLKEIPLTDIPIKTLKEIVYEYIKKNPNCRRTDLYHLNAHQQTIRKIVKQLIDGKRIRECFVVL